MPGLTATERERNFFVIFSSMAGAISVARLLTEPADRQKVLTSRPLKNWAEGANLLPE
jgi:hypothetical protein